MTAQRLPLRRRLAIAMREFLAQNASSGVILMVVAACALVVANSPLAETYFHTLHLKLGPMSLGHWINDGLMAVFFLLVGLEIKREFIAGELSTWPRRILPGAAALGGMIAPALIYLAINASHPDSIRGWAIPAATDIAFALGVLSLLGDKAPVSLKIFLTALAILDDLGAVVIIALFYTADLNAPYLAAAGGIFALLLALNRFKVKALAPYLALGAALWVFVYLSGIHATLAGVLLALTIPLKDGAADMEAEHTPLHRLEHAISPWVAFLIVPIFGFANAGVSLSGVTFGNLADPTPLGVAAGLFFGKQIGVFGASWLMIRANIADLPAFASWRQFYGVCILCGIGFTMSLFIGLLAFEPHPHLQDEAKIGVLLGSALSALIGLLVMAGAKRQAE